MVCTRFDVASFFNIIKRGGRYQTDNNDGVASFSFVVKINITNSSDNNKQQQPQHYRGSVRDIDGNNFN